ncbi:hypothetical protein JCM3770_007163 [Rhodotorula araucariae]
MPTLSKCQARWTETLTDYNYKLSYVPGKQNAVADALSRFSFSSKDAALALKENLDSLPGFSSKDRILYFDNTWIVVPKVVKVWEVLLHDAHDALGHLGPRKTLSSLSLSFYWPGMARDVNKYVAKCDRCQ